MSERPAVGDYVVVPSAPDRGVGRLERLLPPGASPDAVTQVRVFFYDHGELAVVPVADVTRAPPGVWPPSDTDNEGSA